MLGGLEDWKCWKEIGVETRKVCSLHFLGTSLVGTTPAQFCLKPLAENLLTDCCSIPKEHSGYPFSLFSITYQKKPPQVNLTVEEAQGYCSSFIQPVDSLSFFRETEPAVL